MKGALEKPMEFNRIANFNSQNKWDIFEILLTADMRVSNARRSKNLEKTDQINKIYLKLFCFGLHQNHTWRIVLPKYCKFT